MAPLGGSVAAQRVRPRPPTFQGVPPTPLAPPASPLLTPAWRRQLQHPPPKTRQLPPLPLASLPTSSPTALYLQLHRQRWSTPRQIAECLGTLGRSLPAWSPRQEQPSAVHQSDQEDSDPPCAPICIKSAHYHRSYKNQTANDSKARILTWRLPDRWF